MTRKKVTRRRMKFGTCWLPYRLVCRHMTGIGCSGYSCSLHWQSKSNFWHLDSSARLPNAMCWRFWDDDHPLHKLLCQNGMRAASGSKSRCVQKLISFSRSPIEHFSLKPWKLICQFFIHGFTGCTPPCCKFRELFVKIIGQQMKSIVTLTCDGLGDIWWWLGMCQYTMIGKRLLLQCMVFSFTSPKVILLSRFWLPLQVPWPWRNSRPEKIPKFC